VRDTGHGIPEGAIATLFEPFRRRQRAGDYAFSGTGLGLSICRKMVEGMGATLELETASGEGTTFWFEIEAPVASEGLLRTI
jgi:signal transduction histidine kinase